MSKDEFVFSGVEGRREREGTQDEKRESESVSERLVVNMASRNTGGGTVLASGIRTRERKERKLYSDDWALGDEEIEGHHTFDLNQKIKTDKFNNCFVKDMTKVDFNLAYVQKNGFNWPLLFKEKAQLGITIPAPDFSINDVRLCVGSRRMLDVMDVNTQKNVEMTMKDWQRYYESQDKDKLLNVISLEFSHTKLETLVQAPTVVRQVDWVERVWPRHLKEAQTEATNVLEDMMYPKVQKYCLMSVSGCYTDFHIDFGGTSVWYHILRGQKIFWLIPPTERNLQLYEQWVLSGKQSDIFFGDTVDKCARVELQEGNTFFIPTGWIHAVYTPQDSLVFGGNFLHSFGIEKQLRVAQVEDATHVPQKFRYPFFTEMLWYVLERYVHVLLGRTHLTLPPDEQEKYDKYLLAKLTKSKTNNNNPLEENSLKTETKENMEIKPPAEEPEHQHLTQYELHGLKAIVMFLHALPTSKKCVPDLITDPIALIRDVRTVVEKHRYDKPDLAVTSKPLLEWWYREATKFGVKRPLADATAGTMKRRRRNSDENRIVGLPPNAAKIRHRRVRCKLCESCLRDDCRECVFCLDMVKYGGAGTMKQTCKKKKCSQPMLPAAVGCSECSLDGWGRILTTPPQKPPQNNPSSLFECCICYKICHLQCLSDKYEDVDGIVNEDLPNSWECPECVKEGYNKEYKHNRVPSCRTSTAGSDTGTKTPQILSEAEEDLKIKLEPLEALQNGGQSYGTKKREIASVKVKQEVKIAEEINGVQRLDAAPPHMPTWEQLQARVSRPLVRPMWVVRPNPPPPPDEEEEEEEEDEESGSDGESRTPAREPPPPTMNRAVMLPVFHRLAVKDLKVVMQVCRAWAQWAIHPTLWKKINLSHKRVSVSHLEGVVRRQPYALDLSWSRITAEQLSWLLARLPQLRELRLEGLDWPVVSCLTTPYCPALSVLHLSDCEGLTNGTLTCLLSAPRSHRPGHRDTTTRLRQLTELRLTGTEVGDEGVRAIVRSLPFLTTLDLSSCQRVTEITAELLAHPSSVVSHSLSSLDMRGCHRLAPTCLPSLTCLPLLARLALHPCSRIPLGALRVWGKSHGYSLADDNILTRAPPPPPDLTGDQSYDSEEISLWQSSSPTAARQKCVESEKQTDSVKKEPDEDKNKKKEENPALPVKTNEKAKNMQENKTIESKDSNKLETTTKQKIPTDIPAEQEKTGKSKKDSLKVETKKDDSKKDESKKDESKKDESKKCESKKDDSKKEESKKDESKKGESKKDESKKDESKKDESKKDESKKDESKKNESKKDESKKDESKKDESKKDSPEEGKRTDSSSKAKSDEKLMKALPSSNQQKGVDTNANGSARISTRRQSRLQDGEGETTSIVASEQNSSNKRNRSSSPVTVNKKIMSSSSEQLTKKEAPGQALGSTSVKEQVSKQATNSDNVGKNTTSEQTKRKISPSAGEKNIDSPQDSASGKVNPVPSDLLIKKTFEDKSHDKSVARKSMDDSKQTLKTPALSSPQVPLKKAVTPIDQSPKAVKQDVVASGNAVSEQSKEIARSKGTLKCPPSEQAKKNVDSSGSEIPELAQQTKKSALPIVEGKKSATASDQTSDCAKSSEKSKRNTLSSDQVSSKDSTSAPRDSKDSSSSEQTAKNITVSKDSTKDSSSSSSSEETSKKAVSSSDHSVKNIPSEKVTMKDSPVKNSENVSQHSQSIDRKESSASEQKSSTQPLAQSSTKSEALEQNSKKKAGEKKTSPVTNPAKASDLQQNQKNIIITAVEVHRADTYDGKSEQDLGAKRPERRQSVRRSKDEQESKTEEKRDKNERLGTESPKDKRRDSKSREEEMNRITVEDSDKDSKQKKAEEKEKKQSSTHKRTAERQQSNSSPRIKQEKDIVTRSAKRLKTEKELEEKQIEATKEDSVSKPYDSSSELKKIPRRSRDTKDEKEDVSTTEDSEKRDVRSRQLSGRKDKEKDLSLVKCSEKKEEDLKSPKRIRVDTDEYMSKLRRKSYDGDGSSDSQSAETPKKDDGNDDRIRSRRRSIRDEEAAKGGPEKKQKEDLKEEKKPGQSSQSDSPDPRMKQSKTGGDSADVAARNKRKTEEGEDMMTPSNKKGKEESADVCKGTKKPSETLRERSGSRERPERIHRSPRRLSMCQ